MSAESEKKEIVTTEIIKMENINKGYRLGEEMVPVLRDVSAGAIF